MKTKRPLAEKINALLPQTQCQRCGYDACLPYAEAIAQGEQINRCPPGGTTGIQALAELLDREGIPLDPACGEEKPHAVAVVREEECIGCTKCIQACPVDAIIGAAKQMHTVLLDACTGCELCIAPCPVDCIDMKPHPNPAPSPEQNRQRYEFRQHRLCRDQQAVEAKRQHMERSASIQQRLQAALQRAKAKKRK